MKYFNIPFIKLEGVTETEIDKYVNESKSFQITPGKDKAKIGEQEINVEVEGQLKPSYVNRKYTLGKERFEESTSLRVIHERISDSGDDAFIVNLEDDKLGIILKDDIEEAVHIMPMAIPMVWCDKCQELHEPPACE